ncbi:MAG TPA: hypothetical protein VGC24_06355 [Burkholderiaceae bacterium]
MRDQSPPIRTGILAGAPASRGEISRSRITAGLAAVMAFLAARETAV